MGWLVWLRAMLRFENFTAAVGSLKRRLLRRPFLEMRVSLAQLPTQASADEIVGYSPEYLESCLKVLNSVGSLDYWAEERFKLEILNSVENPERDIFLIRSEGEIAGMMVLHPPGGPGRPCPEVGFVAVAPWNRGKNLGFRLLRHILNVAKARGHRDVFLKTDSFRTRAIRTYLKAGFQPAIASPADERRWAKVLRDIPTYASEARP